MSQEGRGETDYDVVVVGGGLAGLSTAYHLIKRDRHLKILLLEAQDRLGGRTLTVPLNGKNGKDMWDVGGQWVGRTLQKEVSIHETIYDVLRQISQKDIMALIDELGLEIYHQHTKGTKVMQLGGDKVTTYTSSIPSLSILALIDLQLFIMKMDRLWKKVDPKEPFSCDRALEWDSLTMEHFIQEHVWTRGARDAIYVGLRTVLSSEPSQYSLLYVLTLAASAGGFMPLMESNENDAQEFKVKGGTQQISIKVSKIIGTERILFNQAVQEIRQSDSGVVIECKNGKLYRCDRAVIAVPPRAQGKMRFSPPLSPAKEEVIKRMPFGNYIKIVITYREAFWRQKGFSGEAVTYGGYTDVPGFQAGPLSVVFDATSPADSPALVTFLAGNQAIQWAGQRDDTRKNAVLMSLEKLLGNDVHNFIDYIEKDWSKEPFIEGAVAAASTGLMEYFVEGLRIPCNRLHFAGAETATEWIGYMSGAVQSGKRAAMEVLSKQQPNLLTTTERADVSYTTNVIKKRLSNRRRISAAMSKLLNVLIIGLVAILIQYFVTVYLQ